MIIASGPPPKIVWRRVGYKAIPSLVREIKAHHLYGSPAAATALGKMRDPQSVDPLIDALSDADLCWGAANALGELNAISAVEPLVTVLRNDKLFYQSRSAAGAALGKIGDRRAVEPLLAVLVDVKTSGFYGREYDSDASVRLAAVAALGDIGDPRAVDPLMAALSDKYFNMSVSSSAVTYPIRNYAVRVLGKMRDPRAVSPLIKALLSPKGDYGYGFDRESIIKALINIGDSGIVEAIRRFVELLGNDEFSLRKIVLSELVTLYSKGRAITPLTTLLGQNIHNSHFDMIYSALAKLTGRELIEPLEKAVPGVRKQSGSKRASGLIEELDDAQITLLTDCITRGESFIVSCTKAHVQEGTSGVHVFSGYAMTWPDTVIMRAKMTITPTGGHIELTSSSPMP